MTTDLPAAMPRVAGIPGVYLIAAAIALGVAFYMITRGLQHRAELTRRAGETVNETRRRHGLAPLEDISVTFTGDISGFEQAMTDAYRTYILGPTAARFEAKLHETVRTMSTDLGPVSVGFDTSVADLFDTDERRRGW